MGFYTHFFDEICWQQVNEWDFTPIFLTKFADSQLVYGILDPFFLTKFADSQLVYGILHPFFLTKFADSQLVYGILIFYSLRLILKIHAWKRFQVLDSVLLDERFELLEQSGLGHFCFSSQNSILISPGTQDVDEKMPW